VSLVSQINLLATRIATECKAIRSWVTGNYQPLDSDLTAIAALSTTTFGRALLTAADAAGLRTTAGLAAIASSGSAADLTAGTIPDARLPTRVVTGAVVADANTATLTGTYILSTSSTNGPGNFASYLLTVEAGAGPSVVQTATRVDVDPSSASNAIWKRWYISGAWGSWYRYQNSNSELAASYQPLDTDLTAIAALATTSYGRSLLTAANAAGLRTLAGLAAIAASGSASDLTTGTIPDAQLPARIAAGMGVGTAVNLGDANNGTSSGWYSLSSLGTNGPVAQDGFMLVSALDTNNLGQIFHSISSGMMWKRKRQSGTWSSWVKIPESGVDVQPLDSDLTAIAALATTTFGRSLLTQADAAATLSTLGIAATAPATATITGGNMTANSTHTDIPGVTLSVTSPGTTAIWLVTISAYVVTPVGWTTLIELLADGTATGGLIVQVGSTGGTAGTISGMWIVTGLASGARVLKARVYTGAAGQTSTVAGAPNTWINAIRLA